MCKLAIVAFLVIPLAVKAEDIRLTELRTILLPMRANPEFGLPARGATPQFTVVKHILRDWIESRLAQIPTRDATYGLEDQLNAELISQKLVCRIDHGVNDLPCPELTEQGYISPIQVHLDFPVLIVQTGVGIQNCGFDESAYAYDWIDKHWRRFWASEQTDYTEKGFRPQRLSEVLVHSTTFLPTDQAQAEHMILTMGTNPWCTSNLQPFYYRVWLVKPGGTAPKLLLDEEDWGMLWSDPPIRGRIGTADGMVGSADDVLVEYTKTGDRSGTGREEVRHYRLSTGRLERIDPIALGPSDFVEIWSEMDSQKRANWTDQPARERLVKAVIKAETGTWHGVEPTRHGEVRPDAWQVNYESKYFLIRWRPPFHFTMLDISDRAFRGCTEKDPEADQFRALFH